MLPRVEIFALQVNMPKLLLSFQNILTVFYTTQSIFVLCLLFRLSCCSLWDKKMCRVKTLKQDVGVLCSDPCSCTGLLTVLDG